jgi:hypothetical protein
MRPLALAVFVVTFALGMAFAGDGVIAEGAVSSRNLKTGIGS